MNFGPTWVKVLGSVVLWLVLNFVFWSFVPVPCFGGMEMVCDEVTLGSIFYFTFNHPFSWVGLVLIYVVWSLIGKK